MSITEKNDVPVSGATDLAPGGGTRPGEALADRRPPGKRSAARGAGEAGLDLSLGHIPTYVTVPGGGLLEVFDFGPLSVVVDREAMSAVKLVDKARFPNLVLRRRAMREFDARVDHVLAGSGFTVAWGKQ